MAHILYNALVTPDGTLLESLHQHHFSSCTDTITGEYYLIDGGNEPYFRMSVNKVEGKRICVTTDDIHEVKRKYFHWGSYGKSGDEPLHFIKLIDMAEEHICAVIRTQTNLAKHIKELMKSELEYRHLELNKETE